MTSITEAVPSFLFADPSDPVSLLAAADWLEERGGDGGLWRELVYAHRLVSRTPPRRLPLPPEWDEKIDRLRDGHRSWFAVGCAVRCHLWVPEEFREETLQDVRDLLTDLTIPAFSDEMKGRANAAYARANAAYARASAAYARADADYARAYAAYARADAASSRADAASSRADAAYARASAAHARADAASSRAYAANSRANAAYSRAYAAERRWQAGWMQAVSKATGVST